MPVIQSEVHIEFGSVDRKRKYRAGWCGEKKSAGAAVLVADVIQASDPQRPALEALLNLSLNALDTLRATRAE